MMTLYSVGHSTRPLDELVSLLHENGVIFLADVRRYPGSKRSPHFAAESLRRALPAAGIAYRHYAQLGGHRTPMPDSPHRALKDAMRGYADHMNSVEFRSAIERLLGEPSPGCFMCAEASPEDCHRSLLADELTRRGIRVLHILETGSIQEHELHPMAQLRDDALLYAPALRLPGV